MNMQSPGVYTNEVDLSFMVPLSAGTLAAFSGEFETGYGNYPKLISSPSEFSDVFGQPTNKNYNDWYQVYLYFKHGAKSLWVSRAVDKNGQFEFLDEYIASNVSNGTTTNELSIKYPVQKIFKGSFIKLFGDTDEHIYKVKSIQQSETPMKEQLLFNFTGDIDASEQYTLTITDNATSTSTDVTFIVPNTGSVTKSDVLNGLLANFISKNIKYANMTVDTVNNTFTLTATETGIINGFDANITSSTGDTDFTKTEEVAASDGAAVITLDQYILWSGFNGSNININDGIYYIESIAMNASTDIEVIGGIPRTELDIFGIREQILNPIEWDSKEDFIPFVDSSSKVRFIYKYPGKVGNDCKVSLIKGSALGQPNVQDVITTINNSDGSKTVTTVKTSVWFADDNYPIDSIIDYPIKDDDYIVVISNSKGVLETFVVSFDENAVDFNNKSMYIENVINNNSKYVYVKDNKAIQTLPSSKMFRVITTIVEDFNPDGVKTAKSVSTVQEGALALFYAGDDGVVTKGDIEEAYSEFANKEIYDISVIIANEKAHKYCVELAESRKDTFTVLGARYEDTVGKRAGTAIENVVKYINDPLSDMNINTTYAGFYGNYVNIYSFELDKNLWVNVAGAIAGLRNATTDNNYPWFANAGINRGILSVNRLAYIPNKGQSDYLYKNAVNIVTSFVGIGNVVYGIKTMLRADSAFAKENIRMLFNYMKIQISRFARSYVFEPNDDLTVIRFREAATQFLDYIKSNRGISDYYIQFDRSPNLIDEGIFKCTIAVKPTRAIEYIQLEFAAVSTGVDFKEILG